MDLTINQEVAAQQEKMLKQTVHVPGGYGTPRGNFIMDNIMLREVAALKEEVVKLKHGTEELSTYLIAEAFKGTPVLQSANNEELEQLRVQLAGCGVAALGSTTDVAKPGDYGWSQSYQDVLDLRVKYLNAISELNTLPDDKTLNSLTKAALIEYIKTGKLPEKVGNGE